MSRLDSVAAKTKTSHRPLTFEQVAELREVFSFFAEHPEPPKPAAASNSTGANASLPGAGGGNGKGGGASGDPSPQFFGTVPSPDAKSGSGSGDAKSGAGGAGAAGAAGGSRDEKHAIKKPDLPSLVPPTAGSLATPQSSAVADTKIVILPATPTNVPASAGTPPDAKDEGKTPPPDPVAATTPAADSASGEGKVAAAGDGKGTAPATTPNGGGGGGGKTKRSARGAAAAKRHVHPDMRITAGSLHKLMRALGMEVTVERVRAIFARTCPDPRGLLFEDFVIWFAEQMCGPFVVDDSKAGAAAAAGGVVFKRRSDGMPLGDEEMAVLASGGANGLGGGIWGSTSQDMSEVYKLLDDAHDASVSVRKLQHCVATLEPDLKPKEIDELFAPLTTAHGGHSATASGTGTGVGLGSHHSDGAHSHRHAHHTLSFEDFVNFLFA